MRTTVKCDECKKNFSINGIEQKKLERGAMLTYFFCPCCGKRYKVNIVNAYLKKLISGNSSMDKKRAYVSKLERQYKSEVEKILNEKEIYQGE